MRLESYLSGYDIADIKLAESGYDYYGFTNPDGSWRILRKKTDGTEFRFAIGKAEYTTNFAIRDTLTYKTTDQYPVL
jgi:hypothetical protein